MQQEQPQLFTIPATVLTNVVNFLAELPFKQVASLLSMIDATVKEYDDGTSPRPKQQRQGRKSK